jgi:Protein of unknown function (DUF664)
MDTRVVNNADMYLVFVDDAIDGMVSIVTDLGDHDANVRPDLADANSAYGVLAHCLGVMEYWGGTVIGGRAVKRDREAEFRSYGAVADLAHRAEQAKKQLRADIAGVDPTARPTGEIWPGFEDEPELQTQFGVLLHIYRELSQHRGQMELGRDIVRAR